jgi:hypothetical protein
LLPFNLIIQKNAFDSIGNSNKKDIVSHLTNILSIMLLYSEKRPKHNRTIKSINVWDKSTGGYLYSYSINTAKETFHLLKIKPS